MRQALTLLMASSVGVAIVVAACSSGDPAAVPVVDDAGQTTGPGPGGDAAGDPPIDPGASGIACNVEEMLSNRCVLCHGTGAPVGALVTLEDLRAKSTKDPNKTRAEVSLQLMKDKLMPIPPGEPAEPDEIADLETWINDGMKANPTTCTPFTDDTSDAGPPLGGLDSGTCTSRTDAGPGNGPLMRPGEACIACHTVRGGPAYRFAGTVYPTFHDPNGCNGSPPPVSVKVTSRIGQSITLNVNDAGNFFSRQRPPGGGPYTIEVTSPKGTRKMKQTINRGDCNGCHTQWGDAGAPGRVPAP